MIVYAIYRHATRYQNNQTITINHNYTFIVINNYFSYSRVVGATSQINRRECNPGEYETRKGKRFLVVVVKGEKS